MRCCCCSSRVHTQVRYRFPSQDGCWGGGGGGGGGVCVSATPLHPRPQKEQGSGALIKFLPRALNSLICLQKKLMDSGRPENLLSAIPTALKAEGWCCSMMPYPFPQSHTSREQQLLQTAGIRDPHQLHFHENTNSRATETQLVQR